jgi:hypothetical protein
LVVDDQAESTDIRSRRHFAASIKQVAVIKPQRCHPKHATPLTLHPLWRMTVSLNDEPERLLVLPPLDDDVADKVMLLKVASLPMPMPADTSEGQDAFWQRLLAELPAFVHYLNQWEIPAGLRSPRFGIATYHHPDLVEQLNETTPENRLLELLDVVLFGGLGQTPWVGTASELTALLTGDGRYGHQARELLKSAQTCGTYLARLEDTAAARISSQRRGDHRVYTIRPGEFTGPGEQVSYFNTREREERCASPLAQSGEVVTQPPSLPDSPPEQPAAGVAIDPDAPTGEQPGRQLDHRPLTPGCRQVPLVVDQLSPGGRTNSPAVPNPALN